MNRTHFLLGLIMVMGLIWEIVPQPDANAKTYDWFLFYDYAIAPQWYAYFTMQHLVVIVLSLIILDIVKTLYSVPVKWFILLQTGQLVDFWLTYNTTWFHIGVLPVTMNLTQIFIFGVVLTVYGRSPD